MVEMTKRRQELPTGTNSIAPGKGPTRVSTRVSCFHHCWSEVEPINSPGLLQSHLSQREWMPIVTFHTKRQKPDVSGCWWVPCPVRKGFWIVHFFKWLVERSCIHILRTTPVPLQFGKPESYTSMNTKKKKSCHCKILTGGLPCVVFECHGWHAKLNWLKEQICS